MVCEIWNLNNQNTLREILLDFFNFFPLPMCTELEF